VESPDTLKRVIGQQLTDEVVAALDLLFPEKTPELNDSIDQIRYASGQRSVIRFLKGIVEG
jgi:hypothetical protein